MIYVIAGADGVTSQMIEIYKKYKCSVIAIEEIPFPQIEDYGVISGDLIDGTNDTYRVTNMFEKPKSNDLIEFTKDRVDPNNAPNFMAIVGRYILTPDIFDILKKSSLATMEKYKSLMHYFIKLSKVKLLLINLKENVLTVVVLKGI